jgi:hypothetical protein
MWPSALIAGWVFVPLAGIVFIASGFCALAKWIPKLSKSEARTDIYFMRASMWLIAVGLFLLTLWALSAVAIRSWAMLRILRLI